MNETQYDHQSAKQITETHKPVGTFPESRRRKSFRLFEPGTSWAASGPLWHMAY